MPLLLALHLFPSHAAAVDGEVRLQAAVNTESGRLDEAGIEADLGLTRARGPWLARGEVRVDADLALLTQERFADVDDEAKRDADVRAAYVAHATGASELTVGLQRIVWGESLYFDVANIVTPVDLREGIITDRTRYRLPVLGVRYEAAAADGAVDLSVLVDEGVNRRPLPGTVWDTPALDPCLALEASGTACRFARGDTDYTDIASKPTVAARLYRYLGDWDLSVFGYHGTDRTPGIEGTAVPGPETEVTLAQTVNRVSFLGATASRPLLDGVAGLELRYSPGQWFYDPARAAQGFRAKSPTFAALATWSRFGESTDLLLSYFYTRVQDHEESFVVPEEEHILSVEAQWPHRHDRRTAILRVLLDVDDADALLQPSYRIEVSDTLHLTLGADVPLVSPRSGEGVFRQVEDNERVYLTISSFY